MKKNSFIEGTIVATLGILLVRAIGIIYVIPFNAIIGEAGGALYGSDAVGGVINIITKKADTSYGKLAFGVGSHDARDMSAMYFFREGKTGIAVSASKDKQGYYKYKDAVTNKNTKWKYPSDYENEKVSLKIEQELANDTYLNIGYDYSKYEGMSPNTTGYTNQEKKTQNFYAKYDWSLNEKDDGFIQVYHNELDYTN